MEGATAASALVAGLTTVASDAVAAIISVIPPAATVLGAMFVVGVGIKAFKKVSGR